MGRLARDEIAEIATRADAGETITDINLIACELRFVPSAIRRFKALRTLALAGNAVRTLPDWIGAFTELTVLDAEDCSLTEVPDAVMRLPKLRRLCVENNDIAALRLARGAFPALEHLRIGGGSSDACTRFITSFDLAPFPALRYAELLCAGLPDIAYSAAADQWNAPKLEFLRMGGMIAGDLPAGLFKAKRLKGLAVALTPDSLRSAHRLKQHFPDSRCSRSRITR